jgi:NADP-dependent 3-hydroxy acid dehydrogenase YdfG
MTIHLKPLDEQVVVITGATSGIGRLAAIKFAEAGAKVVAVGRGEEGLTTLMKEIKEFGTFHRVITCSQS